MVKKFLLDNGVTVLIDRMQDVRSFALGFFVGVVTDLVVAYGGG